MVTLVNGLLAIVDADTGATRVYTGGVVRPAAEAPTHFVAALKERQAIVDSGLLSERSRRNQNKQKRARGESAFPPFDVNAIDLEGALPGDPFPLRIASDGTIYAPDHRARKTEKKRRKLRAELQAAIASGQPLPEELTIKAMFLLKKGRFAKRQYVTDELAQVNAELRAHAEPADNDVNIWDDHADDVEAMMLLADQTELVEA